MKMFGNPGYSKLSPVTLAASWGLVLLMLAWLGWRDYQNHLQQQQSQARQAVTAAAQSAKDYFKDAARQMQQLLEQEQQLLTTLTRNPGHEGVTARLDTALRYRFRELDGFALVDEQGGLLASRPSGYPETAHREQLNEFLLGRGTPLLIRSLDHGYRFDLTARWYRDGLPAGALLITLNCDYLCNSFRYQTPPQHRLQLSPPEGIEPNGRAEAMATATLPDTSWIVVDRLDTRSLRDWLRETLLLRLIPLVLFVIATVLLYTGAQRRVSKLADRSERFRSLFEEGANPQLMVSADSGRILDTNRAAAAYFNRPKESLLGTGIQELLEDEAATMETHLARADNGERFRFSATHTSVTGARQELEVDAGEAAPPGSGLLHLSLTDVTSWKEDLAARKESDEKLEAILEASNDGIVMADGENVIRAFSPAAEMMFGYLEEELLGRPIGELIPACCNEEGGGLEQWLPEGLAGNMGTVREVDGKRRSGEQIPIRVSLNRVSFSGKHHFVAMIQDLTELHRNEEQLAYLERRDALTGLLNRREFERRLEALISYAERPESAHVLCHIDVDQFKLINDTCGHQAGDDLLKQLTMLIKSQLRESETVARVGGDEFGALFNDCTLERGEEICSSLLQTVRNFLFTWRDQSFDVSISIGVTAFRPLEETPSQVLSQGDVACNMAKQLGGNRLHVYHHSDVKLIRHHGDMHLVSAINQALNEGRFHLYAQPIVPVSGKRDDVHYEILVRMVDENGRPVVPEKFVPAAERYILMPAIDRWVIHHLFSTQAENMRRWAQQERAERGFLFGINLSGTSLTESGFLSYIQRQFKDHEVPYQSICFEITETAVVANLDRAKELIEALRDLGCSFALDDFGTGLSSYSYLKILPVDYLKIDGSFVRNMAQDPVDLAMVDSINQIGHILELKTIAEWVENQNTLMQLRALNVDFAQGYGVGEIISLEDFRLAGDDAEPADNEQSEGD